MKKISFLSNRTYIKNWRSSFKTLKKFGFFSFMFFASSSLGTQLSAQTIDKFTAPLIEPANKGELTLFENISNQPSRNVSAQSRKTNTIGSSMPFSLVGVSRIGSNYSVLLRNDNSEIVPITAISGAGTPIPDYSQFKIENISSASVYLSYPDNVVCMSSVNQGVTCNDETNIVRLSLSLKDPIEKKDQPAKNQESVADENSNPFEELLRRQKQIEAEESLGQNRNSQRFRPRRIPDEEIPEGMRVVSTPFGDRLVEL